MTTSQENIDRLAVLLAKTLNIRSKDNNAEEIISKAIDKLQSKKATAVIGDRIENDIINDTNLDISQKQQSVEESEFMNGNIVTPLDEEEIYGAGAIPKFWDYIKIKSAGYPVTRNWNELYTLDYLRGSDDDDIDYTEEEFDNVNYHDTSFDIDNQLTKDQFINHLQNLSYDDYCEIFDDQKSDPEEDEEDEDRFEYSVGGERRYNNNKFSTDRDVRICSEYTDEQLNTALQYTKQQIAKLPYGRKLEEALSISQRLNKAIKMRSMANRLAVKRKVAMNRRATPKKLEQRARRLAIRMLKSKYSGGRNLADLQPADKARLEKIVANKHTVVDKLARRMLPVVKKIENIRFKNRTVSSKSK